MKKPLKFRLAVSLATLVILFISVSCAYSGQPRPSDNSISTGAFIIEDILSQPDKDGFVSLTLKDLQLNATWSASFLENVRLGTSIPFRGQVCVVCKKGETIEFRFLSVESSDFFKKNISLISKLPLSQRTAFTRDLTALILRSDPPEVKVQ